jgi:hypothetical protein
MKSSMGLSCVLSFLIVAAAAIVFYRPARPPATAIGRRAVVKKSNVGKTNAAERASRSDSFDDHTDRVPRSDFGDDHAERASRSDFGVDHAGTRASTLYRGDDPKTFDETRPNLAEDRGSDQSNSDVSNPQFAFTSPDPVPLDETIDSNDHEKIRSKSDIPDRPLASATSREDRRTKDVGIGETNASRRVAPNPLGTNEGRSSRISSSRAAVPLGTNEERSSRNASSRSAVPVGTNEDRSSRNASSRAASPVGTNEERSSRNASSRAAAARGAFTKTKVGESLADVAERVYGTKSAVDSLWRANRDVLNSPDDPIEAGLILRTP